MLESQTVGFSFGIATHVGKERSINQDSAGVWISPVPSTIRAVFVVADGMGGGHAGDEASQLVVNQLLEHFSQYTGDSSEEILLCEMKQYVSELNRQIYNMARAKHVSAMGTTADLAVVTNNKVLIVHVGDGRVYQVDPVSSTQLTEDHSALNDLIKQGVAPEVAVQHVGGNQVTHMVGTGGAVDPRIDPFSIDIASGQTFLLCCDGVHGGLEKNPPLCMGPEDYPAIISSQPLLQAAAENVVTTAVRRDGSDNATCLIFRVEQSSDFGQMPAGYKPGKIITLPGGKIGDLSKKKIAQTDVSAVPTAFSEESYESGSSGSGRFNPLFLLGGISLTCLVAIVLIFVLFANKGNAPEVTNGDTPTTEKSDDSTQTQGGIQEIGSNLDLDSETGENNEELSGSDATSNVVGEIGGNIVPIIKYDDLRRSLSQFYRANNIVNLCGLIKNFYNCSSQDGSEIIFESLKNNCPSEMRYAYIQSYDMIQQNLLRMCFIYPVEGRSKLPESIANVSWDEVKNFLIIINSLCSEPSTTLENELNKWEAVWGGQKDFDIRNDNPKEEYFNASKLVNVFWDSETTFNAKDMTIEKAKKYAQAINTVVTGCEFGDEISIPNIEVVNQRITDAAKTETEIYTCLDVIQNNSNSDPNNLIALFDNLDSQSTELLFMGEKDVLGKYDLVKTSLVKEIKSILESEKAGLSTRCDELCEKFNNELKEEFKRELNKIIDDKLSLVNDEISRNDFGLAYSILGSLRTVIDNKYNEFCKNWNTKCKDSLRGIQELCDSDIDPHGCSKLHDAINSVVNLNSPFDYNDYVNGFLESYNGKIESYLKDNGIEQIGDYEKAVKLYVKLEGLLNGYKKFESEPLHSYDVEKEINGLMKSIVNKFIPCLSHRLSTSQDGKPEPAASLNEYGDSVKVLYGDAFDNFPVSYDIGWGRIGHYSPEKDNILVSDYNEIEYDDKQFKDHLDKIKPIKEYIYFVRAKNRFGNSSWSQIKVSIDLLDIDSKPSSPGNNTNLSGTDKLDESVEVNANLGIYILEATYNKDKKSIFCEWANVDLISGVIKIHIKGSGKEILSSNITRVNDKSDSIVVTDDSKVKIIENPNNIIEISLTGKDESGQDYMSTKTVKK